MPPKQHHVNRDPAAPPHKAYEQHEAAAIDDHAMLWPQCAAIAKSNVAAATNPNKGVRFKVSDSMMSSAEVTSGKVGEAMRRLETAIGKVEVQSQEVVRLRAALTEAEAEKELLQELLSETGAKLDGLIARLEGQLSGASQDG